MIGIRESLIAVLSMLFGCNVGQSQVVRLSVDFARAEGTWNMPALALGQGGLQSDPMIEPHIKEIRELRPQTIRLFLSEYYRIYPDHDVYDFSRLDRELDAIRATGARPTLSLAMKPPMLFPEVDHFQVHPNNYEEWESLCAALSSHCRAQAYDVAAWEVCNEPDIGESGGTPQFFKTAKDYNTFYDHTVAGIRSRDPIEVADAQTLREMSLMEERNSLSPLQVLMQKLQFAIYCDSNPLAYSDPSGLLFEYGSFCGWNARGQKGRAIDFLDRACQRHDKCQATWKSCHPYQIASCSIELCLDADKAVNGGCASDSKDVGKCIAAAKDIRRLFCAVAGLPFRDPGNPSPWSGPKI